MKPVRQIDVAQLMMSARKFSAHFARALLDGTRDELLIDKGTLSKTYVLRRILAPMGTIDAIEFLLDKLRTSKSNADFFESMNT